MIYNIKKNITFESKNSLSDLYEKFLESFLIFQRLKLKKVLLELIPLFLPHL